MPGSACASSCSEQERQLLADKEQAWKRGPGGLGWLQRDAAHRGRCLVRSSVVKLRSRSRATCMHQSMPATRVSTVQNPSAAGEDASRLLAACWGQAALWRGRRVRRSILSMADAARRLCAPSNSIISSSASVNAMPQSKAGVCMLMSPQPPAAPSIARARSCADGLAAARAAGVTQLAGALGAGEAGAGPQASGCASGAARAAARPGARARPVCVGCSAAARWFQLRASIKTSSTRMHASLGQAHPSLVASNGSCLPCVATLCSAWGPAETGRLVRERI